MVYVNEYCTLGTSSFGLFLGLIIMGGFIKIWCQVFCLPQNPSCFKCFSTNWAKTVKRYGIGFAIFLLFAQLMLVTGGSVAIGYQISSFSSGSCEREKSTTVMAISTGFQKRKMLAILDDDKENAFNSFDDPEEEEDEDEDDIIDETLVEPLMDEAQIKEDLEGMDLEDIMAIMNDLIRSENTTAKAKEEAESVISYIRELMDLEEEMEQDLLNEKDEEQLLAKELAPNSSYVQYITVLLNSTADTDPEHGGKTESKVETVLKYQGLSEDYVKDIYPSIVDAKLKEAGKRSVPSEDEKSATTITTSTTDTTTTTTTNTKFHYHPKKITALLEQIGSVTSATTTYVTPQTPVSNDLSKAKAAASTAPEIKDSSNTIWLPLALIMIFVLPIILIAVWLISCNGKIPVMAAYGACRRRKLRNRFYKM